MGKKFPDQLQALPRNWHPL